MKVKKLLSMLLAIVMVVSLTACSSTPDETSGGGDASVTETGAETTDASTDKPVELTYMHKLFGDEKFVGNDDINNNVWTRYYKEKLGIKLNYVVAAAGDDYTQKLTMAIASDDLPDIMDLPPEEFKELADAGLLYDLSDLYDKYASDLLKQSLEADGGTQLASAKVGGKLYGFPQPAASDSTVDLIWVRSDWLKNLGLSAPTNMDELIKVAKAFKNDDPDGNGVDDTWGIGFQNKICDKDGASPGSFEGFFAAYGSYSRAWLKGQDGTIQYSGITNGIKDALIQLNSMYKEGLIDPEFGVKDTTKLSEDVSSGKVGLFYGTEGIPWGCAKSNIENNPKADWVCLPIVSATDKPAVAPMYVRITRYFAVNKNCKNPEAIFKIANVFQEKINSIDSNEETLNTFGVDPSTGANLAAYAAIGLDPAIQKCNTYYSEIKSVFDGKATVDQIHPEAARYYKIMKEYVDSGYDKTNSLGWNYYKFIGPEGSWNTIINDYKANNRTTESLFFGAPTAAMSTNLASLDKLQSETYVNIIMGTQEPDTFDKFVTDWKTLGGDQITKEVNEWHKATFGD